jgi:SAM-dependent methyltransferase
MSIPFVLGITLQNIPTPIPYLAAEPARIAKWRDKLGTHGFKIGIVWQGKGETPSQRSRSVSLDQFGPIGRIDNVRLISLQKGPPILDAGFPVETLGSDFDRGSAAFLDTAAVLKTVDLVITIDTSVAHLAGALGVPTWIAIKRAPDWRWGEDGSTSPWYPTARLFRQKTIGRWDDVFADITSALHELLESGGSIEELPKGRIVPPSTTGQSQPPPAHYQNTPSPKRDYARLDRFLDRLAKDIHPDVPGEPHLSITRSTIEALHKDQLIKPGNRVLDVGCGRGFALELFRDLGLTGTGIAVGLDVDTCRAKGLDVLERDQSFMDFPDGQFDVLWSRQVLQRSAIPLFTLTEYCRVTKPGGVIYVEVPAPDTSAHHEGRPNHYSVLPMSSWMRLFGLAGCIMRRGSAINFTLPTGPDTYWSFVLNRPT